MYNGIIKQSRTLDVLALYATLEGILAAAQNELVNFGLTPSWQSALRLTIIGLLAWLRFQTTGPVGEK